MSDCEQCTALQRQNDLLANDRDGYVQSLTDENNKLRAEVERLRAALGDIHAAAGNNHLIANIARAALEGK